MVIGALTGAIVFLIGLGVSATIDFQEVYFKTLPAWLGSFGIAWVVAVVLYVTDRIHEVYADLRP